MNTQKRVEFYKNQIELEESIIKSANTSVKDVPNVMVKELILGIAMDSNKHSSLLKALIALNTGITPLIPEDIIDQLKMNIKKHIELEQQAIDTYKTFLKELEDEKEKVVVKAILNDEIRHHQLLKRLHEMIVEKEALTEQDIWDWTWRDSLFHGSPGG